MTFARNFSNIDFFSENFTIEKWWVSDVRNVKKWGVTNFVLERTCPEEHLNLSKSGFVSEDHHNGCESQNIAIRMEMFSAKYGLNGPINRIKWTGEVPQWTSSHFTRLAAEKWQDSVSRGQKSSNFLNFPHWFFCSFLDNVEIIVNEICLWKEK